MGKLKISQLFWSRREFRATFAQQAAHITKQAAEIAELKVELAKRTGERDSALAQSALKAAEIVRLSDKLRVAEASLSGAREELRQARRDHALAEERAAVVTADTLGEAMHRLQRNGIDGERD